MATEPANQQTLEETTIVDTDIHLSVSPAEVAEYVDEPYRSHMSNTGYSPLPSSGWDRNLRGKIDHYTVESPEDVQSTLCEDFHIDYPILNATSKLPRLPQTDLAVNLMPAYNDLLIDKYLDEHDHFRGLASLATQEPDKAAEELDRLGDEKQIVGAYIATTGPNPPLGDPEYDIIYKAAQDNDLHIAYHGSGGAFMFEFPRQNQAFEKFIEVHTMAHTWSQMMTLSSLIVNGVPEKFPDVNFTFLEAGIGWIPMMMFRLNKEYSIRRSEAPLLTKSPEEYIREFYFASQPIGEANNPEHMQQLIEMVGADSLSFATDYPHWDFDHPDALDKHLREQFTKEEREKVLYKNAADAFGMDI
ncbi:amidohydrolase family protein [Halorussus salinisoli]|uniref:amidohydrolase family protein n=1 Tax=Halorussus salinisoli TaxID=2558242 RepID=UPI002A916FB4|nr:amidohydrolase family protein [Halorussus salinisoli]